MSVTTSYTYHHKLTHHDVSIMVHVAYYFLQTPEATLQTMQYEPGKAVVSTYRDTQLQRHYWHIIIVSVSQTAYMCASVLAGKPLSFCSRYSSRIRTSWATERIRAPKAKDPV